MNKTTNTAISTQLSHMPTSRLKPLLLTLLMILCIFALASCGSSDDSDEEKTVSEGTETKCEVTGYHDQAAENASMFLKKGDKIAVISPSALPTEEQKDATIEGLKKWGYVPVEGKYVCVKERTLKNCLEDRRLRFFSGHGHHAEGAYQKIQKDDHRVQRYHSLSFCLGRKRIARHPLFNERDIHGPAKRMRQSRKENAERRSACLQMRRQQIRQAR